MSAQWIRGGTARCARDVLAVMAMSAMLAACVSSGGQSRLSALFGSSGGEDDIDSDFFLSQDYCPPVQIRLGTETYRVHTGNGEEQPSTLRYQANIGDTARECTRPDPATVGVKLGIEGRVVAGPQGAPGSVNLPVRVAVVRQGTDEVLYSQLFSVPVSIQGVPLSAGFAQVFNQITFPAGPQDRDMIVFVGFDSAS